MADDLSLLFKLKADNAQAKTVIADTRTAVTSLRSSFGADLSAMESVSKNALSGITENLNAFVGGRLPLIGGTFLRITGNLEGLAAGAKNGEQDIAKLSNTINGLAQTTGKSTTQITTFLQSFVQLESQAKRDEAAIKTFGVTTAQTLIPQLEKAGEELSSVAATSASAGAGIASMAGPIGIAVLAIAALTVGVVAASVAVVEKFFEMAKASADFEGKLFDLSQQTGVSVETLSTLEVALRKTGSNLDSATSSLVVFQTKLDEAQDPATKTAALFRRLGIDAADTELAFRQALKALAAMPEGFAQTNTAAELFGRRGAKQLLAATKETNGDIDALTKKLKDLGILVTGDVGRTADDFNDQLLLVQLQIRAITATLTQDALPAITKILSGFSLLLKENHDEIQKVGSAIGFLGTVNEKVGRNMLDFVNPAVRAASLAYETLNPFLQKAAEYYERIKAATVGVSAATLTSPTSGGSSSVSTGPTFDPSQVRTTLQGAVNAGLEEQKRSAEAAIAFAQRAFEEGKKTNRERVEATIEATKLQLEAEIKLLEADRAIKKAESDLSNQNVKTQAEAANALLAVDETIKTKRLRLKTFEADELSKLRKRELDDETEHFDRLLALSKKKDQNDIARINANVSLGKQSALDGDTAIANIENNAIEREVQNLVKKRTLAGKNLAQVQEFTDQIDALDKERTVNLQKQADRRIAILQAEIDIVGAVLQAKYARQIATVNALAEIGLISAADGARRTLAIQLKANEAQIDAAIALNKDFRLLLEERESIIETGNRNIEAEEKRHIKSAIQLGLDAVAGAVRAASGARISSPFDSLQKAIDKMDASIKKTLAGGALDAMEQAFRGIGEAVGQAVYAFVLYGDAGKSVRQVTAEILASIAQMAAVQAIYELAQGLAVLALAFFGIPNASPSAAAHFAAAAVFGSIAGVAAVAGRSVAGDSFQQKPTASTSPSGGPSGSFSDGSPKPLDIGRRQGANANSSMPPIYLVGEFAEEHFIVRVENAVVKSRLKTGKIRQLDLNNGVLVQ